MRGLQPQGLSISRCDLVCDGGSAWRIGRWPVARMLLLTLILLALAPSPVWSHLTKFTGAERSSTVAEIWIGVDRILLKLEIGDLDRVSFDALLGEGPVSLKKSDPGLALIADDGTPLAGEVRVVERRARSSAFRRFSKRSDSKVGWPGNHLR